MTRRPNHLWYGKTSSTIRACFETPPHPPHPSPKSSQIRSSSLRACRLHRGQPIIRDPGKTRKNGTKTISKTGPKIEGKLKENGIQKGGPDPCGLAKRAAKRGQESSKNAQGPHDSPKRPQKSRERPKNDAVIPGRGALGWQLLITCQIPLFRFFSRC